MRKFLFLLALLTAVPSNRLAADTQFSLDPASPSLTGGLTPADVLLPGPVLSISGGALGLQTDFPGGAYDNINSLSFNRPSRFGPLFFSVDRVAVGLPGTDVYRLAQPSVADAARNIFEALRPAGMAGAGSNRLAISGDRLGLQSGFFGDALTDFNLDVPTQYLYFTLDAFSASITAQRRPNDILFSAGDMVSGIFAKGVGNIGLNIDDEIDALVLVDRGTVGQLDPGVDQVLFSLSPFSPNTFTYTGMPYLAGAPGQSSPGDVLYSNFDGNFTVFARAEELGLRADDNLTGLEVLPEPPGWILLTLGLASVGVWVWRKSARAALCLT